MDDGYSGTTFDRPAFREMEKMIENGEIGTVIVKDMSRLGRNYLQVGMYTDIVFPENDVRFIAINDNVDSAVQTEFDMTPIRNFCNELYARDTAKKIKSTFKMKGESGKHLTTNLPFGYIKDKDDKDKWLIDEPAAIVVRKIFDLCANGFGPLQIAKRLRAEEVLIPTAYYAQRDGKLYERDPFNWDQKTVSGILDRVEYLGHTVNFKTTSKNYKSKKRIQNPPEKQLIFKNTHPAIISDELFETVQKIREGKRRPTATGKISLLSGKVICADCKAKLHYCTTNGFEERQDFFTCANYRSNMGSCSAHYIRNVTLCNMVFKHIKKMLVYVQQFEETFVRDQIERLDNAMTMSISKAKVDVVTLRCRDEDLNTLFKRLYEDMVSGRITAERFDMLAREYEQEQKELKVKITELDDLIENGETQTKDLKQLLVNVRKYTDPQELTAQMVNDLVDKIVVYAPDKSSGHRRQKIEIYYNAVGIIDLPTVQEDACIALHGRCKGKKIAV